MTNIITRIMCSITGTDFHLLMKESGWSRKKVSLLGMVVLLPALIWTLSTFFMVNRVLDGSLNAGVFSALVAGLIIFAIERSIIMTETTDQKMTRRIKRMRWSMGLLVAILGAFVLDNVIFDHDIRWQVDRMREAEARKARSTADTLFASEQNAMQKLVDQRFADWQQALDAARREAEGSAGSGLRGVHDITKLKLRIAEQKEAEYRRELTALDSLKNSVLQYATQAEAQARARFDQPGLLLRIDALHQLAFSNLKVGIVYAIFLLLMLLIEVLPVTLKFALPESSYEYAQRIIDQVRRRQLETLYDNHLQATGITSVLANARNGKPASQSMARFN